MAYYATQILQRVIGEGTGRGADIGRPAAGKTGTTSDYRDAWFGGYTPELATVVWMGYEESSTSMEPIEGRQVVGGTYPADIWKAFMSMALEGRPVKDFKKPDKELLDIEICTESGLLPALWCPEDKKEFRIFVKGNEPKEICDLHNKISVPDLTGMTEADALSLLDSIFIGYIKEYEFNDNMGQGIVFSQEPTAGTIIESVDGEPVEINIKISKGLETFAMPDLIGLQKDMSEELINGYGLDLSDIIYEFNANYPKDTVYGQDPSPSVSVTKGQQVILYISKGLDPFSVIPSVIGMDKQTALAELSSKGFINVVIVEEDSIETIDTVFEQDPGAQTSYEKAKEVKLWISRGIMVPDVVGMALDEAVMTLEDLGFTVEISPEDAAGGIVEQQQPESDSYLNKGQTVIITVPETIEEPPDETDSEAEETPEEIE
jgi:beta-lactam-binding protein with PASTA domain